jgi:pantoate--beta-alanine ligase
MIATGKIAEARKLLEASRMDGLRTGFVPTMGALHDGHRSLVRRARAETGFVVVSIFVNPAQFNAAEDLAAYPRMFSVDLEACAAEGADLVFHPDSDEIYPRPPLTTVNVEGLTETMEGEQRPGHFAGVALVCAKLFNIVGECTAYFGEKDAQQLRVIRRMVADLDIPVGVVACPTIRDRDGLALSSRNVHLTDAQRTRALALPRTLREIADRVREGERDVARLQKHGKTLLEAAGLDAVDYLEIVDPETLESIDRVVGPALVCAAVRVGATRLIDNLMVGTLEEA